MNIITVGLIAGAGCYASSPVITGPWSGAVTTTSAVVKVNLKPDASAVRLLVDTQMDMVGAERKAYAPGQLQSMTTFQIGGLRPDTRYYYAVETDGTFDPDALGTFRTFPEGPASFRFAFASCARTGSTNAVFTTIKDESPLFFLNTGDLHYEDISKDDPVLFRTAYQRVLNSPAQADLYRDVPFAHMWDDHDYTGNGSDATAPARTTARRVYQEWVPHYPLAAGEGDVPIYQSFVVGRVKFILSDLRSERSPVKQPDDANKSMLGAKQKRWLQQELLSAQGKYPVIFWLSSVPWISAAAKAAAAKPPDHWGSYTTERRELADFVKQQHIRGLCILGGDAHMLAADDGANSDYATGGGAPLPVLHAAALDQKSSSKGGPYSQGKYLPTEGEGCYGLVTVEDQGGPIHVAFSGRNHRNEEKVALEFTVSEAAKISASK